MGFESLISAAQRLSTSVEALAALGAQHDCSGGLGGTHFCYPVIELPRQVGNDAKLPLN